MFNRQDTNHSGAFPEIPTHPFGDRGGWSDQCYQRQHFCQVKQGWSVPLLLRWADFWTENYGLFQFIIIKNQWKNSEIIWQIVDTNVSSKVALCHIVQIINTENLHEQFDILFSFLFGHNISFELFNLLTYLSGDRRFQWVFNRYGFCLHCILNMPFPITILQNL